ncbi:MAG: ABC transporter permease [Acidobacteriota bacterium]
MIRLADMAALIYAAARSERLRSSLTILGIAIGIASVILLTSFGEGTHRFVLNEFTQFGSNLLAVNPGRVKTMGIPGVLGGTTHRLSLEDARSLTRVPGVLITAPLVLGTASVEFGLRQRAINVYGVTSTLPDLWKFKVRHGQFLPAGDIRHPSPVAVLGPKLKKELFLEQNALGKKIRVGGRKLQVIGVMEPKGQFLGIDIDDSLYIPVSLAMDLFNLTELYEIDILFSSVASSSKVAERVRRVLKQRHGGNDDVTITTQTEILSVLDSVLGVITVAVGAIGAVALLVGGIGILTVMWISVHERNREIGLCRALGATTGQIMFLFLAEAAALAAAGGCAGALGFWKHPPPAGWAFWPASWCRDCRSTRRPATFWPPWA